jgi:predicted Kef-type K+ transport protein
MSEVSDPEGFYARALDRIRRCMIGLAMILTPTAYLRFGWRAALGFALGCGTAYLNFDWLKRVVQAMADRITQSGTRESGRGIVIRFALRYLLVGAGCYVILKSWSAGLGAFLAGLALPVAAIACETAYEVYLAIARET